MKDLIKNNWLPFIGVAILSYFAATVFIEDPSRVGSAVFVGTVGLLFLIWPDRKILHFLVAFDALMFYIKIETNLVLLVFPTALIILILKTIITRRNVSGLKVLTPYCLFFLIVIYWWIKAGTPPRIIYGGISGIGNFSLYFNCALNFIALLLPFFLKNTPDDLKNVFVTVMWIYIVGLVLVTIAFIMEIYFPLLVEILPQTNKQFTRVGSIARLSYYVGIFIIFFGRKYFGRLIHIIVYVCFLLNLFWGGGRMELVMLVSAYLYFLFYVENKQVNSFTNLMIERLKRILAVGVLFVILFSMVSHYLPEGQMRRFREIVNPLESSQLIESSIKSGARIAQWKYAVVDSEWLPFGRGFAKHFLIDYYGNLTLRQVRIGGAHNIYISIFYIFGYVGFLLFGVHLFLLVKRLKLFYKFKKQDNMSLFICIFLAIYYLPYAFLAGGINNFFFLPYFLTGYVMKVTAKSKNWT